MENHKPNCTTSDRLKEYMNIFNINQAEIMRRTNLSRSTISQWVSGAREPNQRGLVTLGKALNVSEVWLMGFDVPMQRVNHIPETENVDMHIELISIYDNLSAEQQEEFLNFGRYLMSKKK